MRTSARGSGPRYLRIADELEERIRRGELARGARVPSTREIVNHWDVAMATATRVLAELRDRGLVRARPGVGTVVVEPAPPRPEPPQRRPSETGLTRDRLVWTAVAIADADGLASVSMRRLASDLGVAPMSLYRHVRDKDDLVLQMLDAVYGQWHPPADPPPGWRARLELAARDFWAACRAHPWVGPATQMMRPQVLPGILALGDFVLAALADLALDHQTTMTAYIALMSYIRGMAVDLETEAEQHAATGMDNESWMEQQQMPVLEALLRSGAYPAFARLAGEPFDYDLDAVFDFGLQRFLDGLQGLTC